MINFCNDVKILLHDKNFGEKVKFKNHIKRLLVQKLSFFCSVVGRKRASADFTVHLVQKPAFFCSVVRR